MYETDNETTPALLNKKMDHGQFLYYSINMF